MAKHPLDSEFRFLEAEARKLRGTFADLRAAMGGAATGRAGTPAGAQSAPAGTTGAADAQAARESFARQARELVRTVAELRNAAKGAGGIARSMGLADLGRQLDVAANKLETVHAAAEGLTASLKVLRAAFVPLVVATAAVVGPLLVTQKVFEQVTGKALTLTQTIQVMGLSLVKFAAQHAADVTGGAGVLLRALGLDPAQTEEGQIAIDALQAQINEIVAQGNAAGSASTVGLLKGLMADIVAEAGKLASLVPESDSVVGRLVTPDAFRSSMDSLAAVRVELEKLRGGDVANALRDSLDADLGPLITQAGELRRALAGGGEAARGSKERLDLINAEIDARRTLLEVQIQNETPMGQLASHFTELASVSQATFDVITQGTQQLAATVSSAIIQGFLDPQADIRQSFADLFGSLAQMILQTITQLLIAQAIAAAISGLGGLGGGAATAGAGGIAAIAKAAFHDGGRVPGGRYQASLAHLGARGYADGGRPLGLPASDTIPAWLTPGEFVLPVQAASRLTPRALEALRRGAINAGALDALAGGLSLPARTAVPRVGYADGGAVVPGSPGPAGAMGTVQVAPSEQNLARQLAGGQGALVRHFRENAAALKSALGVK